MCEELRTSPDCFTAVNRALFLLYLYLQASPCGKRNAPCAGFEDLHSFAFIGNSGRIATASDGLFSYVPAGPNKQIDMFLRAYDLRKEGRLEVRVFIP